MALDQQLTVLAWSPLRNGLLSGKYLPEHAARRKDARMDGEMMKGSAGADETVHAAVREVAAVGRELGVSAAQVALAWLRTRPVPVIPIIGARRVGQLTDDLGSVSADQLARPPVRAIVFGGLRERIRA